MAELTALAVEDYTQGRLNRDDPETARLLSAALRAARRYCGWHVAPEMPADEIKVDGPGGRLLVLPTLHLVDLVSVIEDDTELDLSTLDWSARGLVRKKAGGYWSCRFGAVTVVMRHGFDDADDFNTAVLSFIDRSSQAVTGGRATVIGPFQWSAQTMASGSAFSDVEKSLLDLYRLELAP